MVLCSLFENTVKFYEDNQGAIELTVYPQIKHRTKRITIKYHQLRSFVANSDVEIKHIDINEHYPYILGSR